jgi:hypothetical protein
MESTFLSTLIFYSNYIKIREKINVRGGFLNVDKNTVKTYKTVSQNTNSMLTTGGTHGH